MGGFQHLSLTKGIILILLLLRVGATSAGAAEISCIPTLGAAIFDRLGVKPDDPRKTSDCEYAVIKGRIETGDSEKFSILLNKNQRALNEVLLWSEGGSLDEAMKIGRMIRKALVSTSAPRRADGWADGYGDLDVPWSELPRICRGNGCSCASACFLIWAAGYRRSGTVLGLHRPSVEEASSFAHLSPERASGVYQQILSVVRAYLAEMEIPSRYVDLMTDTDSNKIFWLNNRAEAISEMPSIAEWLNSACGRFLQPTAGAPRSAWDKYEQVALCRHKKLREARGH